MMKFAKPALALGVVGALALAVATPSEARNGRNAAAIGAGVAGFAVGAAIGSAAAANNYYYAPAPAYGYYEPAYTYAPAPAYGYRDSYAYSPGPTRYYGGDPSSYYAPTYSYPSRWRGTSGPNHEDQLTGSGSGAIR